MQRTRKENGTAKIVIRIEKECQVGDVKKALDQIHGEIKEGSSLIILNIDHFDEVKIDNKGDMATKRKYVAPEKQDAAPQK